MSLDRIRVLLLHPEDDPERGPWAAQDWDRVVDLGSAGEQTRDRWSRTFGCPIEAIPGFEISEFSVVRRALSSGFDCVVDEHGLDWWELISIRFHEQIVLVLRLEKFAAELASHNEVWVTRPGLHSRILGVLLNREIKCFRQQATRLRETRRVIGAARKFKFSQLIQIFGDKYDAGYKIRRFTSCVHQERFGRAVVLMPVAQGNAARTAVSYAATLPAEKFLLVATRQSGLTVEYPDNVLPAKLASYAGRRENEGEFRQMLGRWQKAEATAIGNPEISVLMRAGVFSGVTKMLRDGIAIRDAWLGVFERETVSAVLCSDDTNPYTHIPLLIARKRGMPTIACHHGALDGNHLAKRSHADIVLAKGQMENDYLVETCGLKEEKVEIGAPSLPPKLGDGNNAPGSWIIFFSEPYALDGGRCREFYRELLPPLVDLAFRMDLELIVKLHPMESARERRNFVKAALAPRQRKMVRVVEGALTEELLEGARFAVTVQSTAAVDCAIRGIPVFLCKWLDYSYYGYVDQFVRYCAGVPLHSAAQIANIPNALEGFPAPCRNDFWQTISSQMLQQLLTAGLKLAVAS
jgi:hypothetical protein